MSNQAGPTEEDVHQAIARLEPAYREFLRALVMIPSPVGSEGEAQALVDRHMRQIGLAVDSFDVDPEALKDHPQFNPTPVQYAGRPCLVGRRAGTGGGRSLILNAHIDTVPVEAAETWTHPPFSAVVKDGRLYGRGAWDDKAGVAECLLVAHALQEARVKLRGDLIVKSVIEDESSGNGSLASVVRGHTADGVIIVDGTWPERYIVSHMGQVSFRIRLGGRPGHATSPGPNPISAVGQVVDALRELVRRRNAEQLAPWGVNTQPVFLNLGSIHGGVWPGSVPAECVLEGQFGFPPPATCDAARRELLAVLVDMAARSTWPLVEPPSIEFCGLETPAVVGASDNPIAVLLSNTIRRLHGKTAQESVILGHCDLRHYTQASGGATAAACLYGPGGGKNAHGTDEYFELAHLPVVARNLASVALEWCR